MRFATLITISVLALAACSPEVPNSAAGVGFPSYGPAQPGGASALPQASAVSSRPLSGGDSAANIAADATAALGVTSTSGAPLSALSTTTSAAVSTSADGAAPRPASISDEQNFAAVSGRETIASDAQRIAVNRAQYVVIEPTALPGRPDGSGVSIVAYALATNNSVGQQLFERSGFGAERRFNRSCAKYGPNDNAQEVFLDAGGPDRDRYGMDPDGDGFACYWDPRPFRAARGGAPDVVTDYEVVETPGES